MSASIKEALKVYSQAKIQMEYHSIKHNPTLLANALLLPNILFFQVAKNTINIDPEAKFSMLQMLEQGKKTEIDDLNGKIVELGKKYNVPTPVNSKLVELVHEAEKHKKSPKFSGSELYEKVLGKPFTWNVMLFLLLVIFLVVLQVYYIFKNKK